MLGLGPRLVLRCRKNNVRKLKNTYTFTWFVVAKFLNWKFVNRGAGVWNEEIHNSYTYFSVNIITVIKSSRMRLVGCAGQTENMRNAYSWSVNPKERDYLEDLDVDWMITFVSIGHSRTVRSSYMLQRAVNFLQNTVTCTCACGSMYGRASVHLSLSFVLLITDQLLFPPTHTTWNTSIFFVWNVFY
jgi:hypothetical protein